MNTEILAKQFIKPARRSYRRLRLQLNGERLRATSQKLKKITKLNNETSGIDKIENKLIRLIFAEMIELDRACTVLIRRLLAS